MVLQGEKYLLIYPFGNSDLAFNGEETFPRESYRDFRAHLETLNSLIRRGEAWVRPLTPAGEAFPCGLDFTRAPRELRKTSRKQEEFIVETLCFPILVDVLHELFEKVSPGHYQRPAEVHIQPIVTDQSPPHPQDTLLVVPLVRVFTQLINQHWQAAGARLRIRAREPWVLKGPVSHYDCLLRPYEEFYERIRPELRTFERIYFSLTTGTPAMSFAAGSVFAVDSRITFIYKPRGARRLVPVEVFRDRVRRQTLDRLRTLLDRFDFRGALEVCLNEQTGFTKREIAPATYILEALAAWQNYDFQGAVEAVTAHPIAGVPSLHQFRELCEWLAQADPRPGERPKFWRTKITDTLMRLEIAVYRRDLPDVLYQFYNYNDVCLAWGLNAHFPELDVHAPKETESVKRVLDNFGRRCPGARRNLHTELGKFQLLCALFESGQHRLGKDFNKWFRKHQLLRWFQDCYVDSQRHRLVHGSVQLREKLFDQIFRDALVEWGASDITVEDGEGPWLLLGLVHRSFRLLPDAQPVEMIRELAAGVWETVSALVTSPPAGPDWLSWGKGGSVQSSKLSIFEGKLKAAFSSRIRQLQETCNLFVLRWKEDIARDIKRSGLAKAQRHRLLARLQEFKPPQLGYYLAQGFIDLQANLVKRERAIKFEILASLHPSFDFKTCKEEKVKGLLGEYLSKQLTFEKLFATLNPPKGHAGAKLNQMARKRPLRR